MMYCYYPTTTVTVDDDLDFLTILSQHLSSNNCKSFHSPLKALQHLSTQSSYERLKAYTIKTDAAEDMTSPESYKLHFNIHNLHKEIYHHNRFQDVSVIIVDYYMDNLNGIDFCEKLTNHFSKKILLTGGADKEKVAIEAFNKGSIHRFINKSDANFLVKLKQAILALQDAYFRDLSSTLFPHIASMPLNLYHYPSYINFIHNIKDQFECTEYYMLDTIGSTLMFDTDGNPTWFIVKHESELANYEELAHEQDAPSDVIQRIADRTVIPFFFSEEDYQQPAIKWKEFLYPCQPLPGISNYYYAISHNSENHIDKNKIISYSTYQQTLKNKYALSI